MQAGKSSVTFGVFPIVFERARATAEQYCIGLDCLSLYITTARMQTARRSIKLLTVILLLKYLTRLAEMSGMWLAPFKRLLFWAKLVFLT